MLEISEKKVEAKSEKEPALANVDMPYIRNELKIIKI